MRNTNFEVNWKVLYRSAAGFGCVMLARTVYRWLAADEFPNWPVIAYPILMYVSLVLELLRMHRLRQSISPAGLMFVMLTISAVTVIAGITLFNFGPITLVSLTVLNMTIMITCSGRDYTRWQSSTSGG